MNSIPHTYGLSFKKLDLHLHTPASRCFADKSVTADQIISAALARGLAGIAVTDHNSGAWIQTVQEAAAKTPLVIFPGVEITCMGGRAGIHVIALFDPSQSRAHVESLLSELGLRPEDYGNIKTVVQKTPLQVVETVHRRGGLAILAHANSEHGALNEMRGEQRIKLVQCPYLFAVEATDFQDDAPGEARRKLADVLDGTDQEYQRRLAVYQASDNPHGDASGRHGLAGIGGRCSYFKVDQVNLDGIRQCFYDPGVRIRQDFAFRVEIYPRISRITIRSGFLDGMSVPIHEGLNSILGAKGAGKSLLIEFLRFALDQPPANPEILEDHHGKLAARLEAYGSVEVEVVDETGHSFTVKRTFRDEDDSSYDNAAHTDIARLFPVLFLSQNEIIRIAESEDEQIAFIDRFFDFRAYRTRIQALEEELIRGDGTLADSLRAHADLRALSQSAEAKKAEIAKLDTALKQPVFEEYRRLEAKAAAFREQLAYFTARLGEGRTARQEMVDQEVPGLPTALKDDAALRRTHEAAVATRRFVEEGFDALIERIEAQQTLAVAEFERWQPLYEAGKRKYDEAVKQEGGDTRALAAKRARLVKEEEALAVRMTAARGRGDRLKGLADARRAKVQALQAVYEEYSRQRKAKCELFETESAGRLQVAILESSNRDAFRDALLAMKRGSYLKDAEIERLCSKVDPGVLIRGVINYDLTGKDKQYIDIAELAGLDKERVLAFVRFLLENCKYEDLLALEYRVIPSDRPQIRYNIGAGTFEPLRRLSIGQKATAMLIMALSDGTMPIVIDQPEDSLDIRSVWEDMCKKIRQGKEKRQFIFTTHNSSLAVAGDSDKFLILEGSADGGRLVFSGSMDDGPVSEEVLKYLEGGVETYKLKYLKYNADRRLQT